MVSLSDLAGIGYAPTGADATLKTGSLSALAQPTNIKPNFFGQGGAGRNIAGYIGDALLALGGQKAMYAPYVQGADDRALERLLKQTQIAKALQPDAPHYFEANNGDQGAIDASGKVNILYHDPTPKINWITSEDPDTHVKTLIPTIGGVPQLGGQTPQGSASLPSGFTVRKAGAGSGQPGFR